MSEPTPCKRVCSCIQFQDFVPSTPTDKIYYSTAQTVTVTCPSGVTATVNLDAGLVAYALTFPLGNPPYPDLVLNCSNSTITVPVPDNTTQDELDALIVGMLNQCLQQIATNIGCVSGVFFNTQQSVPCPSENVLMAGAFPAGVTGVNTPNLTMAAGTIQSTISVADANAKALLVLQEIFQTGNATCGT